MFSLHIQEVIDLNPRHHRLTYYNHTCCQTNKLRGLFLFQPLFDLRKSKTQINL